MYVYNLFQNTTVYLSICICVPLLKHTIKYNYLFLDVFTFSGIGYLLGKYIYIDRYIIYQYWGIETYFKIIADETGRYLNASDASSCPLDD